MVGVDGALVPQEKPEANLPKAVLVQGKMLKKPRRTHLSIRIVKTLPSAGESCFILRIIHT